MKKFISTLFACTLFCYAPVALAQTAKEVKETSQLWPQIYINCKIAGRWTLHADGGYRTQNDLVKDRFQKLIRLGITYQLGKTAQVSTGYAYFETTRSTGIDQPEHRPWQQLSLSQNYGRLRLQHRYRLEERFFHKISSSGLEPGYKFNWRGRYQLQAAFPLNAKSIAPKTLFAQVQDEIFVNFGSAVTYNYFDQNRLFLGLGYQFSKELTVISGYQHTYVQESSGNVFDNNHVWRINVYLNFDFSKPDKTE